MGCYEQPAITAITPVMATPITLSGDKLVGGVCSRSAQKEGKKAAATLTVDSLDTPSSARPESWLVVARSASARLQLVGHLGWVHRQEARAVGRPRERMGGRR